MKTIAIVLASGLFFPCTGADAALSANSLSKNALASNSMSVNALAVNALSSNSVASNVLGANALADSALNDDVVWAMHDLNALTVLRYILTCALVPGQGIELADTLHPYKPHWPAQKIYGELGLAPGWLAGPPSTQDQELVSGCLLARVNPFGIRVPLSMSGNPPAANPTAFDPANVVSPVTALLGKNIESSVLFSCKAVSKAYGIGRDCGWDAGSLGTCSPGSVVEVGAGCTYGAATGDTMLRVCAGDHVCKSHDSNFLVQDDDSCAPDPKVTFTCPPMGLFTVMTAPYFAGDKAASASPAASNTEFPAPMHPAPEARLYSDRAVFPWREGAFFGNIFGSGALQSSWKDVYVDRSCAGGARCKVVNPNAGSTFVSPYARMFHCTSGLWTSDVAYSKLRICAGGASNCPGVYVGRCLASDAPDGSPSASATEAADKHFSSVWGPSPSGGAVEYTNPITTFLADPWDGAAGRSNPAVRCAMFTAGNVTRPALECSAQY